MRFHVLTVEAAKPYGGTWQIAPKVHLRSFVEREPRGMLMPMAGEEVELRLPDGQAATARIASFGLDVWKDENGNLYTDSDPPDPYLTLTITRAADTEEVPIGTEIWLTARFAAGSKAGGK